MLFHIREGRTLSTTDDITENIYIELKKHPKALVITMTRKAAFLINDIIINDLFNRSPLALIVMENEQLVPLYIGMKLLLTQNMKKKIAFLNGQIVMVSYVSGYTIGAVHPFGSIINIFPVTRIVNDVPATTYPCMTGCATTISKIPGQTLNELLIWLDTPITPAGTACVALS